MMKATDLKQDGVYIFLWLCLPCHICLDVPAYNFQGEFKAGSDQKTTEQCKTMELRPSDLQQLWSISMHTVGSVVKKTGTHFPEIHVAQTWAS